MLQLVPSHGDGVGTGQQDRVESTGVRSFPFDPLKLEEGQRNRVEAELLRPSGGPACCRFGTEDEKPPHPALKRERIDAGALASMA